MLHVPLYIELFDRSHLVHHLLGPMSPEDGTRLWSYSVQGTISIPENNAYAGPAETLSFCYREEPDVCSIFVTVLAKARERSVELCSVAQEKCGQMTQLHL